MHLSKVKLVNYRNFSNTKFIFSKGTNTIIGENGSGKTNLFRAIRLLLDDSMRRSALRLNEKDFFRGLGNWRGHWIIISLEFDDVSQDEAIQAIFLHGTGNIEEAIVEKATYNLIFRPKQQIRNELSQLTLGDKTGLNQILSDLSIDEYETVITGRSSADFNDPNVYKKIVGDFDNISFPEEIDEFLTGARLPQILSMSREVSFTFVQALRDVVSEFHNNRTNPLLTLLKNKSGEIDQIQFKPIVNQVNLLNKNIESLSDVKEVRDGIKNTIDNTVGDAYSPQSLSIKSDLSNEADQIFQSLKLFIAESEDGYEGAIHEMSLGGANLIYLTLKLLEFKYQKNNYSIANFLLIEEPEAHIHTHIQKSLFDKINYTNTQVIYSTHSSHISEVSNVKNINILGKVDGKYHAFQPTIGLTSSQIEHVQRYLDAVRSNLLFAKSVVLVEGDAEEILIPSLIKEVLGISLDELGISLVNIRSTGFENVALLFHEDRIRKKCSIITDLDTSFIDTSESANDTDPIKKTKKKSIGSEASGVLRKVKLDTFCENNFWLAPFYAPHTFEVNLIEAGNQNKFTSILNEVYTDPITIATSKTELESNDIAIFGKRALTMAKHSGKGWFAIILAKAVDFKTIIPPYIIEAIMFTHGSFADEVVFKILNYRFQKISEEFHKNKAMVSSITGEEEKWYAEWNKYLLILENSIAIFKSNLQAYIEKSVNINALKTSMQENFPNDAVIPFFNRD